MNENNQTSKSRHTKNSTQNFKKKMTKINLNTKMLILLIHVALADHPTTAKFKFAVENRNRLRKLVSDSKRELEELTMEQEKIEENFGLAVTRVSETENLWMEDEHNFKIVRDIERIEGEITMWQWWL